MNKTSIATRYGVFDYANPSSQAYPIEEIAEGLSKMCRYAGRCDGFYSVAQHSLLVARLCPPRLRLAGLMHDASEAYTGDCVGPFKRMLPDFKLVEGLIETAIEKKYGITLSPMDRGVVKYADLQALKFEQKTLMSWAKDIPNFFPEGVDDPWPEVDELVCYTWEKSMDMFLYFYEKYSAA